MFRDHSHIGSPKILDSIVETIQSVYMCKIKKTRHMPVQVKVHRANERIRKKFKEELNKRREHLV